jgi:DNA-binding XRE family transcriptional regulator
MENYKMAKTNWDRYFASQMQDEELRALVEAERAALEIGHRLATLRRKRRLSQTQVAAALKMSPATISRIEHNASNVTIETLLKVARALGASLDFQVKAAQ